MANKLDLSIFKEATLPLVLLDGKEINLLKPSQKLMFKMMDFQKKASSGTEQAVAAVIELFVEVMNNNKEKIAFTAKDFEDYDFGIIQVVIQTYTNFINEVMSNPN